MDAPPSIAGFPTEVIEVALGAFTVPLLTVRRLEDYVDTHALLADADAPEPPYWAHLWTGARALARLIATSIDCRGLRVVDIGCGLGLTAVVAARRGGRVTAFDLDRCGVEFARANARLNGCEIDARVADVVTLELSDPLDIAFAADVTYDPALQISIAEFLARHLASSGRAWCAESVRTVDTGFQQACRSHGLKVVESELHEIDDGRDVRVRLTSVSR